MCMPVYVVIGSHWTYYSYMIIIIYYYRHRHASTASMSATIRHYAPLHRKAAGVLNAVEDDPTEALRNSGVTSEVSRLCKFTGAGGQDMLHTRPYTWTICPKRYNSDITRMPPHL